MISVVICDMQLSVWLFLFIADNLQNRPCVKINENLIFSLKRSCGFNYLVNLSFIFTNFRDKLPIQITFLPFWKTQSAVEVRALLIFFFKWRNSPSTLVHSVDVWPRQSHYFVQKRLSRRCLHKFRLYLSHQLQIWQLVYQLIFALARR